MMNEQLKKAADLLCADGYTCVFVKDSYVMASTHRGVSYLLELYDSGNDIKGFYVADKVVGKGAAFIYVLMGVRAVFAPVMSQSAKQVLQTHGIAAFCDECPQRIMNRTHTGYCPIESAVHDIASPHQALDAIRKKLDELKN